MCRVHPVFRILAAIAVAIAPGFALAQTAIPATLPTTHPAAPLTPIDRVHLAAACATKAEVWDRVVAAADLSDVMLGATDSGVVQLFRCRVAGDFLLGTEDKDATIRCGLNAVGCTFDGNVLWKHVDVVHTVNWSGSSFQSVKLDACTFKSVWNLIDTRLNQGMTADSITVQKTVRADGLICGGAVLFKSCPFLGPFSGRLHVPFGSLLRFETCSFKQLVSVTESKVAGRIEFADTGFDLPLRMQSTTLTGTIDFSGVTMARLFDAQHVNQSLAGPAGSVTVRETDFSDEVALRDAKIGAILFQAADRATRLQKRVSLERVACGRIDLDDVQCAGTLDLTDAHISQGLRINESDFGDDVYLTDARLPQPAVHGRVDIDGTRFHRGLFVDWHELPTTSWLAEDRDGIRCERQWDDIAAACGRAGDLASANEAIYRSNVSAMTHSRASWLEPASCIFWGFGVRPWRLAGWILLVQAGFTTYYFVRRPTRGRENLSTTERWMEAAHFGTKTVAGIGYGIEMGGTTEVKVLATIHSVLAKIVLVLLLQALANTWPLLNSILNDVRKI